MADNHTGRGMGLSCVEPVYVGVLDQGSKALLGRAVIADPESVYPRFCGNIEAVQVRRA
jgi:hypothetical protein